MAMVVQINQRQFVNCIFKSGECHGECHGLLLYLSEAIKKKDVWALEQDSTVSQNKPHSSRAN